MPQILPWQRVDPREAAHFAASRAPAAVQRLRATGAGNLELLVCSGAAARDWLPDLAAGARRLLRRAWPGPLSVLGPAEGGLAARLPGAVRTCLGEATLTLRSPAHEAIL